MNPRVRVISLTIPDDLLDEIDRAVKAGGYASRSEVIRAACREFLERMKVSKIEKES